jgi:hypothetical protein
MREVATGSPTSALRYRICSTVRWGSLMMSLVRLLGFTTLACGCVTGHYREVATNREITYVEEKGTGCDQHGHRRNHTLTQARGAVYTLTAKAS